MGDDHRYLFHRLAAQRDLRGNGQFPRFADGVLLGENLLPLLTLALGAALVVGNVTALLRPPANRSEGDLPQAPLVRTTLQIAIGLLAAVWALASLLG